MPNGEWAERDVRPVAQGSEWVWDYAEWGQEPRGKPWSQPNPWRGRSEGADAAGHRTWIDVGVSTGIHLNGEELGNSAALNSQVDGKGGSLDIGA